MKKKYPPIVRAISLSDPMSLAQFGWLPGGYVTVCRDCERRHGDTHKTSRRCQACASEKASVA